MQIFNSKWYAGAAVAALMALAGAAQAMPATPITQTFKNGTADTAVAINHLRVGGLRDPVVSYTAPAGAPGYADVVLDATGYVPYVAGQSQPGLLADLSVGSYNLPYTHFSTSGQSYNTRYVAWNNSSYSAANPINVTFTLKKALTVSTLKEFAVWFDNEPAKSAYAPSQIILDGTSYDVGAVATGNALFDVQGLSLRGGTHTVGFVPGSTTGYTMISEVQFFQQFSAAPEAATWSMMIFGIGAVGASLRSRRRLVAA